MKSTSKNRTPNIVNLTVKRRYLTEREIERLMDYACKHGRYGHREATMMLVAYRHGLRASGVCDLNGSRSSYPTRGHCSITSGTKTSSTRSGTPRWRLATARTPVISSNGTLWNIRWITPA